MSTTIISTSLKSVLFWVLSNISKNIIPVFFIGYLVVAWLFNPLFSWIIWVPVNELTTWIKIIEVLLYIFGIFIYFLDKDPNFHTIVTNTYDLSDSLPSDEKTSNIKKED